jgi:hypothetical protein
MTKRVVVIIGVIMAAALMRLVPHEPNFTPIGAMALFGGAYLRDRRLALLLPLAAMLLSDVVLNLSIYNKVSLISQPIVYACIAAIVGIGTLIRDRHSVWQIGAAMLAGSILFFVVTNLAVWLLENIYPLSRGGLLACFAAAIPFFQNSLLGDSVYTTILFGGFALLERGVVALRESTQSDGTRYV